MDLLVYARGCGRDYENEYATCCETENGEHDDGERLNVSCYESQNDCEFCDDAGQRF